MSEKIQSVEEIPELISGIFKNEDGMIYRGQSNINWRIRPNLLRDKFDHEFNHYYEKLFFIPLGKGEFDLKYLKSSDPFEYLALCQHYGIKTRLLDFTYNPYVALYFACSNLEEINNDGVFVLTDSKLFKEIQPDTAFNDKSKIYDKNDSSYYNRLNINDVHFYKLNSLYSPRLNRQNGCFLVFPIGSLDINDLEYPDLNGYIRARNIVYKMEHPEVTSDGIFALTKPVDKRYKMRILDELDKIYDISERTLYVPSEYAGILELVFKDFESFVNLNLPNLLDIIKNKEILK